MRSGLFLALVPGIVVPVFASAPSIARADEAAAPTFIEYTVKNGDTCTSLTEHFYGDPKKISAFHAANPQLGAPPHHLTEGMVLHIATDAQVSFVRNEVQAFTPEEHAAHPKDPLMRGHRVDTEANSSAEVLFADQTRLQLGEHTLVVILGARSETAKVASGSDTTLMRGTLRAHLAELAAPSAPVTLATGAGHKILVQPGSDILLGVDDTQTSRLAVHHGKSTLRAAGAQVIVPEGFGSKAEKSSPPTPPRPLPDPPVWAGAFPSLLLATQLPTDVTATYAAGTGPGPVPARWHIQLARDERFNDLVVDASVGASVVSLQAKALPAGTYVARVSAVDNDGFEGKPSAVSPITVVAATETATKGQHASLSVPESLFCGLDGAPLAHTPGGTIEISRARSHRLRCAVTADGKDAAETLLPARSIGSFHAAAALTNASAHEGRLSLRLTDAGGGAISGAAVTLTAPDGVTIGQPAEVGATGVYEAAVSWTDQTPSFSVTVHLNGLDVAESSPVGAEGAQPAPALAPSPYSGELAILGGFASTSDQLGLGPALAVEAGARRSFGGFSLGVAVRAQYEHYSFDGQGTCSPAPSPLAGPCASHPPASYGYTLDETVLTFELPITARLGRPEARFLPYLGVAPGVVADRATLSASSAGQSFGGVDSAGRFSFHAFGGVQLHVGPGGFFVEAGYRVSPVTHRAEGDSNLQSFVGEVGYRLTL